MSHDARDILAARAVAGDVPRVVGNQSTSYYSSPTTDLDPALFDPHEHMHPFVRDWILTQIRTVFDRHFHHVMVDWWRAWVAGSGATYQWGAARNPGDLDVLIGVDFQRFRYYNLNYAGLEDNEIASHLNGILRTELWPLTAQHDFGNGSVYEVTFYVNPTGTDIRDLHPYAAYNVTKDEWTVRPPELDKSWNPDKNFPPTWQVKGAENTKEAKQLITWYRNLRRQIKQSKSDPDRVNKMIQLERVVRQAEEMYNAVHNGRREAFSPGGQGYMDWYTYQWQRGKKDGWVPALHALAELGKAARDEAQRALYGEVLIDSKSALTAASLIDKTLDSVSI